LIDHVGERNLLTKIEVRHDAPRGRTIARFEDPLLAIFAANRTKLRLGAFWACQGRGGAWI
jgi:hypothetical protein